jgi:hypothetical protein
MTVNCLFNLKRLLQHQLKHGKVLGSHVLLDFFYDTIHEYSPSATTFSPANGLKIVGSKKVSHYPFYDNYHQ